MTDYMKEAERLSRVLEHIAQTALRGVDNEQIRGHLMDAAALLAHIQRGAVPVHCTPTEHEGRIVYEHTSEPIPNADGFVLYAPAPDQFRDAAKMMVEPSAFLARGARYKISNGTVRGLPRNLDGRWVALVAAEDDCHLAPAPAEAPMPEPDTSDISGYTPHALRTYGAACRAAGEAAGYARALAEAVRTAQKFGLADESTAQQIAQEIAALRGEVKP